MDQEQKDIAEAATRAKRNRLRWGLFTAVTIVAALTMTTSAVAKDTSVTEMGRYYLASAQNTVNTLLGREQTSARVSMAAADTSAEKPAKACCASKGAAAGSSEAESDAPKACPSKDAKACSSKDAKACPSKDAKACSSKDAKACSSKDAKACSSEDAKACSSKDAKACSSKEAKVEDSACPSKAKACSSKPADDSEA